MESRPTATDKYRCSNGRMVRFGCATCVRDLEKRLQDMIIRRDDCQHRSADRSNYNGILASLRRDLKSARKIYESEKMKKN